MESVGLYAQVLGDRWHELAEIVRRLHTPGTVVRAAGIFSVRRGNRLARVIASIMGLPAECDAVDVQLTVTPTGTREEWRRLFGAKPFVSLQWLDAGKLFERIGLSETQLEFDVVDGGLHYRTGRTALRLGFIRLPLPRFLAPRVIAWEKPDGDKLSVHIEVHLPMLGHLITYEGTLASIEARNS
ncbi:MAG: DUF4166 domain-containing protein [Planctomycetes bacterium]|nr:DUF4166 domain-containing protein [Planctomycetota bacterium]